MRNWTINTTQFNKDSSEFIIWKLEQLINFGLAGEKISKKKLTKYFSDLRIDPDKRRFIKLILQQNNA